MSDDALAQGSIRQHSRSGLAVVCHMRWISRTGDHTRNRRLGEYELQEDLCPTRAADLASPIG